MWFWKLVKIIKDTQHARIHCCQYISPSNIDSAAWNNAFLSFSQNMRCLLWIIYIYIYKIAVMYEDNTLSGVYFVYVANFYEFPLLGILYHYVYCPFSVNPLNIPLKRQIVACFAVFQQAITWTNNSLLWIEPLITPFSAIWMKILTLSRKCVWKVHLQFITILLCYKDAGTQGKWWCLSLINVLNLIW